MKRRGFRSGALSPGSAAEEAGLVTNLNVDFQGEPRPQGLGPDIGADGILTRRLFVPQVVR